MPYGLARRSIQSTICTVRQLGLINRQGKSGRPAPSGPVRLIASFTTRPSSRATRGTRTRQSRPFDEIDDNLEDLKMANTGRDFAAFGPSSSESSSDVLVQQPYQRTGHDVNGGESQSSSWRPPPPSGLPGGTAGSVFPKLSHRSFGSCGKRSSSVSRDETGGQHLLSGVTCGLVLVSLLPRGW